MDQIVITEADKGGKIVIMGKSEYINKIEEKFRGQNVYEELVNDPTQGLKTEISNIVTRLHQQDKIKIAQK